VGFDPQEIAEMFSDLSLAQCDGWDPCTHAGLYSTNRWNDYDEERRRLRARDHAFDRHEHERWARANLTRKRKRRGLHLSNAERVRLADRVKGGTSLAEVSRETGVSVTTAAAIGQLSLWEV